LSRFLKRSIFALYGKFLRLRYGEILPEFPSAMHVPSRWVTSSKLARIKFKRYEQEEIGLVNKFIDKSLDTVELGTGLGVVSSEICRVLQNNAGFFGIEANPELVEVAQKNISRFSSESPRIVLQGAIVGKEDGASVRDFFITPENFHYSNFNSSENSEKISVPVKSLSSVLEENNLHEYQLVSDIEGAELEILLHDSDALRSCKLMIIELHETESMRGERYSISDLCELLEALGFFKKSNFGNVFVYART